MRQRRALLLSGGQEKGGGARALAVGTRLLLLDFEGLAPALSRRLADVIGV